MDMDQQKQQGIINTSPDDVINESNNNGEGGGGGLVMKIKMVKAESLKEEQGNNNRKPETLAPILTEVFCNICPKGFKSGKALGGHMRKHVQESKGLIKTSSKSPKPISTSATDSGEHVCIECTKKFPSKKSLYGHMRSHPERPYRGIEPPPPQSAKNSSTSTLSDANLPRKTNLVVDKQLDSAEISRFSLQPSPKRVSGYLSKDVLSWSQTSEGGKKSTSLDSQTYSESHDENDYDDDDDDDVDEEEDMSMNEAVYDLMMLSQANPKGAKDDEATNNNNFMTKKRKRLEVEEDEEIHELEIGLKHDIENEISDSKKSESIVVAKMNMKKRKMMKLEDLDGAMIVDHQRHHQKVYTCGLCQTHQALGGHMSSHKNLKKNNSLEHEHHHQLGFEDINASTNVTNIETSRIGHDQAKIHQCRMCNTTFVTGQALGGHMRSHWNGPNDQAQAQSSQTGRKGLDFDLNELPPMEDEQGNYIGAGYATAHDESIALS